VTHAQATIESSVAGFHGVLDSGLGVVDLADNLVLFGREFDADHKTGFPGAGPGESQNRDRLIIAREIQARWHKTLLDGLTESVLRAGFHAVKEHVGADRDGLAVNCLLPEPQR
jgi:hypothetical protein